ncbi:MAG: dolichyl-phosphate beta-glucosyltransferase [Candidatus Jorgensenbacteria bacterium]
MKPFLSVIIPAWNEEQRLPLTLVDVERRLSAADFSSEVIVVNDGSRDGTAEVAEHFHRLMPNLRVIDNPEHHGKGWVVRQGMLAAKGNWRLFMDADNTTSVGEVEHMVPYFSAFGGEESYDVLIGSRDAPGAEPVPPQPWYRWLTRNMGNLVIRALLLPGVQDARCGFKCFSEEAAARVFRMAHIDGWGFDVEALALAKHLGYRIKEVPVRWVVEDIHPAGTTSLSTLLNAVRVWWWFRQEKYSLR